MEQGLDYRYNGDRGRQLVCVKGCVLPDEVGTYRFGGDSDEDENEYGSCVASGNMAEGASCPIICADGYIALGGDPHYTCSGGNLVPPTLNCQPIAMPFMAAPFGSNSCPGQSRKLTEPECAAYYDFCDEDGTCYDYYKGENARTSYNSPNKLGGCWTDGDYLYFNEDAGTDWDGVSVDWDARPADIPRSQWDKPEHDRLICVVYGSPE